MDGSRSLAIFPAEVLSDLLRFVTGASCFKLILCGSRALNQKIRGPRGVIELRAGYSAEQRNWMFRVTRLFENLQIISYSGYGLKIPEGVKDCFPPSITKLELVFTSAERDWVNWCSQFPKPEIKLPNLRHLILSGNSYITMQNMKQCLFPGLQTLCLLNNSGLSGGFCAFLPRSLLHLELHINYNLREEDLSKLPPNLEYFHFIVGEYRQLIQIPPSFAHYPLIQLEIRSSYLPLSLDQLGHLPLTLRRLTIDGVVDSQAWPYLPPKLECLCLHHYNQCVTSESVSLFPRSLTHLRIMCRVEDAAYSVLPPNLLYLHVNSSSRPSTGALRNLPHSLIELRFDSYNTARETIPILADLPRNLRVFHCPGVRLDIEDAKLAPPKLHHLRITNNDNSPIPLQSLLHLPKSLQRVELSSLLADDLTMEHFRDFFPDSLCKEPFSLRRFAISIPDPNHRFPVPFSRISAPSGTNYLFTERCLSYIPQSTKTLEIDLGNFWADSCIPELPSQLTSLSFSTATLLTDKAVEMMPSTITELSMPHCDRFTDFLIHILLSPEKKISQLKIGAISMGSQVIQKLSSSSSELSMKSLIQTTHSILGPKVQLTMHTESGWVENMTDEDIAKIPKTISTIILFGNHLSPSVLNVVPNHITDLRLERLATINGDSLKHLPAQLTRLELPWADKLIDDDVSHLPPSLTHLDFRYAKWLTDSCIRTLPRSLTYLNISSAILTDASVPYLPQLHTLCADYSKYSEASVLKWPRSLTSIELGDSNRFQTVKFQDLPPNLTYVKWRWNKAMILECQLKRPKITIPNMVLYREGLLKM